MRYLVTGSAGFIGSTLALALLRRFPRDEVTGIDCLTPFYSRNQKEANLRDLSSSSRFRLLTGSLQDRDLRTDLSNVDVVFHCAGQPGVRTSWNDHQFTDYVANNIVATYCLLTAAASLKRPPKLVYSSSSSIYGNTPSLPVDENFLPQPYSPYGVTKLAAEHLCQSFAQNHGLPAVSLRYFTVYGPRQRPDMAIYRIVEAALTGSPFKLFGSGQQRRSFTYVEDVVDATIRASYANTPVGIAINVAGDTPISLSDVITLVEESTGHAVPIERREAEPGDVKDTQATTDRARQFLGWVTQTGLQDGIGQQVQWHMMRRKSGRANGG